MNRRELIQRLLAAGLVAAPSTKFIFDLGKNLKAPETPPISLALLEYWYLEMKRSSYTIELLPLAQHPNA